MKHPYLPLTEENGTKRLLVSSQYISSCIRRRRYDPGTLMFFRISRATLGTLQGMKVWLIQMNREIGSFVASGTIRILVIRIFVGIIESPH